MEKIHRNEFVQNTAYPVHTYLQHADKTSDYCVLSSSQGLFSVRYVM